ncbi:hypothetical protein BDU57DRAFT_252028 [Ampelomyces quisqualis]|uniref:Uncharacterized protein n=1 Tax=Ampelomyces quisqualis TaxID=50730 RepID=A0A6A5QR01_AMPQU|nr:hypothetical protein BDU57DRAFT_252028 [Ampelomyces quisqualis]
MTASDLVSIGLVRLVVAQDMSCYFFCSYRSRSGELASDITRLLLISSISFIPFIPSLSIRTAPQPHLVGTCITKLCLYKLISPRCPSIPLSLFSMLAFRSAKSSGSSIQTPQQTNMNQIFDLICLVQLNKLN